MRNRTKRIPLYRFDRVVGHALIDERDFEFLQQWQWRMSAKGYAVRYYCKDYKTTVIWMHREIVGLPTLIEDDRQTDHLNGDKLDNRRVNLRITNNAGNQQNRHGAARSNRFSNHRGVSWDQSRMKWRATAQCNGKYYTLGRYASEEEASKAVEQFWQDN